MRQTENQIILQDGELDHSQHAGVHSFLWHTNVYKYSTNVEKVYIETFVITEGNRTQTALYNQKLSSFNISNATCCPHIMLHQPPPHFTSNSHNFNPFYFVPVDIICCYKKGE